MAELQAAVVAEQVAAHEAAARRCLACGTARGIKGRHPLTCRTAFVTLPLTAMRLRRCRCGADPSAGDRASFSPLADSLPGRTTPELLCLETRWGALVSCGLAARMLGEMLPMDRPVAPERVRRHLLAVAACEDAAMGEEPDGTTWAWSGCRRDLDDRPPPNCPAYVDVDGGCAGPRLARTWPCRPGRACSTASWRMPSGADGRGSSRRPRPNRTRQGSAHLSYYPRPPSLHRSLPVRDGLQQQLRHLPLRWQGREPAGPEQGRVGG